MGTQLKGDFIGFSFDGNHSSDLGIVRTSNGSRYDDNLLPTSQDQTAAVPGGDGTYYWDTSHTQKPFNIPIASANVYAVSLGQIEEILYLLRNLVMEHLTCS